ncbi:uncharacterized protein RP689-like [Haliotis asinina]|uniref:uncharacterized protein RP689-like n=1 Tax=Haliotis asinina TaxID=109174 RepID=UPI0035326AE2
MSSKLPRKLFLLLVLFLLAYLTYPQTKFNKCTLPENLSRLSDIILGENFVQNKARSLFFERITEDEREQFRNLMRVFHDKAGSNITYFLYAGSLLGSYSHHGMIPWDDDIDIIVRYADKEVLLKALESLAPRYEYTEGSSSWKFYQANSSEAGLKPWKWPYLDIFFYYEYPTYIQDAREEYKKFNTKDVFPLSTRPFMAMTLPAPRNTLEFLRVTYDIDMCKANSFDHKREVHISCNYVTTLPCHLLRDRFPFVRRVKEGNKTVEILEDHLLLMAKEREHETAQ